jgi:hypothetical protein
MASDPGSPRDASAPPSGRRLDSWKEIAEYLRRGITTVQRWEREEALPVRRHLHSTSGSVFAYADDIDAWLVARSPEPATPRRESTTETARAMAQSDAVPGGAMPLDSPYYIRRPADDEFHQAVARRASIVLVKGPRQVGKSSLLARALHHARQENASVVFTDIQALGSEDLRSADTFYQALARSIADQIAVKPPVPTTWNERDSPNTNFSRYVQRTVLGSGQSSVIWGLDEVDRLLGREYAVDVFGLFRSWHNRRALDPAAPWRRLTLALAYATEPHLLMRDVNQSPFNVGVRVDLQDLTDAEVMALNGCYGSPLGAAALARLGSLVGGHPYLLQCAFPDLTRGITLEVMETNAARESGPLGDHLRHVRELLQRDTTIEQAMNEVLRTGTCPGRDSFYRLRSAGLIQGLSPGAARPRCGLYARLATELP